MENNNKTTYSFRITAEQKEQLQAYQKQFDNQSDFVNVILDLLNNRFNGVPPQPQEENKYLLKIELTPEDGALLEWAANNESTEKIIVTRENLLMYVFKEFFVNGNQLSYHTIPDSVIRKIRKEVAND
jgi:hypothetical protein